VSTVRPFSGARAATAYGPLVAVGISHRTATVALREQAALTEPAARALLGDLRSMPSMSAAAVLSTCNRTEVYALSSAQDPIEPLRGALAARGRLGPETVAAAGFHHTGPDALRHLFRVAAGLDSMVVGEPEIQHQVRRTAAIAAEEGMLGAATNRAGRAVEARRAEPIVADEVARYLRPRRLARAAPRLASAA
jgi:glutamyl-tRNA reductase